MPSGVGKLIVPNKFNWGYNSEPEPYLGNRTIYVPRGKGLGGSSLINGMAYVRGQPQDYDGWRQMGNRGWGWDDVLPYFKKSQHRVAAAGTPTPRSTAPAAGFTSPIRCIIRRRAISSRPACGSACRVIPTTTRPSRKASAFCNSPSATAAVTAHRAAFLADAARRPNLAIATEALVRRIVFDGNRATGVEFARGGETRIETAAREVILCAGAINSPKLLMLSGIGPGAALQEQGIAPVHDLPGVGRNLQDHLYVHYTADSTPDSSINAELHGLRAAVSRRLLFADAERRVDARLVAGLRLGAHPARRRPARPTDFLPPGELGVQPVRHAGDRAHAVGLGLVSARSVRIRAAGSACARPTRRRRRRSCRTISRRCPTASRR